MFLKRLNCSISRHLGQLCRLETRNQMVFDYVHKKEPFIVIIFLFFIFIIAGTVHKTTISLIQIM